MFQDLVFSRYVKFVYVGSVMVHSSTSVILHWGEECYRMGLSCLGPVLIVSAS